MTVGNFAVSVQEVAVDSSLEEINLNKYCIDGEFDITEPIVGEFDIKYSLTGNTDSQC